MPASNNESSQRGRRVSPGSEEDLILFDRFRQGDEEARDALIGRYASWVTGVARRYQQYFPSIEMNELIAEGNKGVLEALYHFQPSKSVRFSTYAWYWIVKNVQEYITRTVSIVDFPGGFAARLRKVDAMMQEAEQSGRELSLEEVSKKLDMNSDDVRGWLTDRRNMGRPVSLDRFMDDEDRTETLGDTIEDHRELPVLIMLDKAAERTMVEDMLSRLAPSEREVIRMRFGFEEGRFYPLKDIAVRLKIHPSKVKDIEVLALIKLRRLLQDSDIQ